MLTLTQVKAHIASAIEYAPAFIEWHAMVESAAEMIVRHAKEGELIPEIVFDNFRLELMSHIELLLEEESNDQDPHA